METMVSVLRPAGSDPRVVCQKNFFSKVSVSLSGFGPSVAHGKLSVRGRCVQATKTRHKLALDLSLMPLGAVRAAAQGTGYKYIRLRHPTVHVYASTGDWSCPYGTIRCESETTPCFPARYSRVSGETQALSLSLSLSLSSTCIIVDTGNFTVTPEENFVSPLVESSPSPGKH